MSRRHPRHPRQKQPPPWQRLHATALPHVHRAAAASGSAPTRQAARWPLATLLLAGAVWSAPLAAQEGLLWRAPAAPGIAALAGPQDTLRLRLGQGGLRLDLDLAQDSKGAQRAHLLGDVFLTGPGFGQGDVAGGLRLTSGVMVGPAQDIANLPPPRLLGGAALRPSGPANWREPDAGQRVALPYIGLGYTSASAREGWGLSADIGLGGMRPGERLRLGHSQGTAAQAERVLNELRLAPVLQLGVSYAF